MRPVAPRRRGVSAVEMMIGIAVAMLVIAGALSMHVNQVVGARRLLAQARLTQDLRAATDLIARDLRRAGFWGRAVAGTRIPSGAAAPPANPYTAVQRDGTTAVGYTFSRDGTENDAADASERFGFRVQSGALQMQVAQDQWQDVTDVRNVVVPEGGFRVAVTDTTLPLGHLCATPCAAGVANCPTTTLRQLDVSLTGRAAGDAALTRTVRAAVRLRNDHLQGQCPA